MKSSQEFTNYIRHRGWVAVVCKTEAELAITLDAQDNDEGLEGQWFHGLSVSQDSLATSLCNWLGYNLIASLESYDSET